MGVDYTEYSEKDKLVDVILAILFGAGSYGYWLLMLMLVAFLMVHTWSPSFAELLVYAIFPSVVSEICYVIHIVRKRRKEEEMRRYTQNR